MEILFLIYLTFSNYLLYVLKKMYTFVYINLAMAAGGSSFISKPARGWLHPDNLVSKEGITYTVKVCYLHFTFYNILRIKILFKKILYIYLLFLTHKYKSCLKLILRNFFSITFYLS